jgi:hypothetical protein
MLFVSDYALKIGDEDSGPYTEGELRVLPRLTRLLRPPCGGKDLSALHFRLRAAKEPAVPPAAEPPPATPT